jgi:hypothetical protein
MHDFLNEYFNLLYHLHVSNPRVHLQEDGCIFRYGMVCFTCISISSLIGDRVYSVLSVCSILSTEHTV